MARTIDFAYFAMAAFAANVACSSAQAPPAMFGSACSSDSECASGSSPAGPLVCNTTSHTCVECYETYGQTVGQSMACINGRTLPCADLPAATTCGCGCAAGEYCSIAADQMSGQCKPLIQPGGACDKGGSGCSSGVCYSCTGGSCYEPSYNGTCSVPLGADCTLSTPCPSCVTGGNQTGWCSAACGATSSPSGIAGSNCPYGFVCLGASQTQEWGLCYEVCNSDTGGLPGTTGCPAGTACKSYLPAQGDLNLSHQACQ